MGTKQIAAMMEIKYYWFRTVIQFLKNIAYKYKILNECSCFIEFIKRVEEKR